MACKGICTRYKAQKPQAHVGGRYGLGQKRCQVCCLFIEWDDLWCPCCHYRLRVKPHNPKSKRRVLAIIESRKGGLAPTAHP